MNKKCLGCGITIQNNDKDALGYSPKSDALYCERCFRIKNYNEAKFVSLPNSVDIIDVVNKKANLVLFLTDITNLNKEVIAKFKSIKTKKVFVINKTDVFPKSLRKESIINYLKEEDILERIIFISTKKKFGLREIINLIEEYSKVYLVGYTNSGKSSLINALKRYYNEPESITTSIVPNTTIDFIKIKLGENVIYDSPGFVYSDSIYNSSNLELIRKTDMSGSINPVTLQIKENDRVLIEDLLEIKCNNKNSFTFYMSNNLKIDKVYKDVLDLEETMIEIKENQDLIIKGLGFINIKSSDLLKIKIKNKDLIEIRDSIIGK